MTDTKDAFHQSMQSGQEYHVGAEHPLKTISSAAEGERVVISGTENIKGGK